MFPLLPASFPTVGGFSHHHLQLGVYPFKSFSTHIQTSTYKYAHHCWKLFFGFCFFFLQKWTHTIYIGLQLAFFFHSRPSHKKSFHMNTYRFTSFFLIAAGHGCIIIYLTGFLLSDNYLASNFSPSQSRLQRTPCSHIPAHSLEFFCGGDP